MITRYKMRQSQEERALRQFTLSTGESPYTFFCSIGFIMFTFSSFVYLHPYIYPVLDQQNCVNILQVIAQVSLFLILFKYDCYEAQKHRRVKHLLLLCFFCSILSSLYLRGIDDKVLFFIVLFFLILILIFPLEDVIFLLFPLYFLDKSLAKWSFHLTFQIVGYYVLSFFLEREESSKNSRYKNKFLSFIVLLFIQSSYGLYFFDDFFFNEPLKLAALLSGACILFISLTSRATWGFFIPLLLYLTLSLFIGLMSSPYKATTICGIPHGIFIFFFFHLWAFIALLIFNHILLPKLQSLIPLFFGAIFFFLRCFPELNWLNKWIEGIDLFLFIFAVFSFLIEEEKRGKETRST